ncbi:MAG: sugar phosphate isomerase/epimerase [Clostridia bacterium]|nr:sugar phosphate isomerase/epimerase [Clostridia bacterium]
MLLGINTHCIEEKFGLIKTIDIYAEAGFDAIDLTLCKSVKEENGYFIGDDYLKKAKEIKEYVDSKGLVINQAHAYYPTSYDSTEETAEAFKLIVKGMEIAATVEAKAIVVHPNLHINYNDYGAPEKLKELNYNFYKLLIPYAEKFGIKIAIENLFQWKFAVGPVLGHCVPSVCSRPEEHIEYLDSLNSDYIVACVDVGHTNLVGQSPAGVLKALGHRVKCLHIHDNDTRLDTHMIPETPNIGTINWDSVCKALAEMGYDGDFTFETDGSYLKCNEQTVRSLVKYNHDVGRYLIKKIESYK